MHLRSHASAVCHAEAGVGRKVGVLPRGRYGYRLERLPFQVQPIDISVQGPHGPDHLFPPLNPRPSTQLPPAPGHGESSRSSALEALAIMGRKYSCAMLMAY